MYGYIYKTTNKLNNKIYIGQKKSSCFLKEKYLGSGKYLKRAIDKYGEDNFFVELIDTAESREELSNLEIYYIEQYNSIDKNIGYNIAKGGIGGGEVYVNNGIKNEFITKAKLNEYLSDGWKLGMLPGRKEVNHSASRGRNISKSLKGKNKTAEHIKNHSESLKKSNRHWYTNGILGQDILLKSSDNIPDGYYRGRTVSDDVKKRCGIKNLGKSAWNKGLTKETDDRVKKYADNLRNKYNKEIE